MQNWPHEITSNALLFTGWFRGYNLRDPVKNTGVFPANHVAIKPYNVYNG